MTRLAKTPNYNQQLVNRPATKSILSNSEAPQHVAHLDQRRLDEFV